MNGNQIEYIRPIDKTTVHQICSGQVVLNLATAVKELLENSLDAGATCVQIKLIEHGSDLIEIIDNGCGVDEVNFQALTLKHHTSKISQFSDIYNVKTFGFRGEALSSLCALSNLTITTQHRNAAVGAALKFNHNGIITSNTKIHRKFGTTVQLQNIFCTLPIRRTEFLKNLKKEFSKMCNVLYAYGLISTGIRITCTNNTSKSKICNKTSQDKGVNKELLTTIMDTKGESIESNITSIFGIKIKENLVKLVEKHPTLETLQEFGMENTKFEMEKYKLEGYISSCARGCGKSGPNKQFYYINSRPIDNPKIFKLVNNIYHQFNSHEYPFVILNIKIADGLFDINLAPDKRQVLIQKENILLAIVKQSLFALFEQIPPVLLIQNVGLCKIESNQRLEDLVESETSSAEVLQNTKNSDFSIAKLQKFKHTSQRSKPQTEIPSEKKSLGSSQKQINISDFCFKSSTIKTALTQTSNKDKSIEVKEDLNKPKLELLPKIDKSLESLKDFDYETINDNVSDSKRKLDINFQTSTIDSQSDTKRAKIECEFNDKEIDNSLNFLNDNQSGQKASFSSIHESNSTNYDQGLTVEEKTNRNSVSIAVSLTDIKGWALRYKDSTKKMFSEEKSEIKFIEKIKPQNNKEAEMELTRTIKKENFSSMEILGQFNLGFIITKLESDLFIIDQHASDEKFNFETLRNHTVMQTQRMVNPETLNLTPDKEEIMIEHKELFKKNGFDFTFDENEIPTKRIKLLSIPMSKNVVFGKEDVEELLFLLEDVSEKVMIRPSRMEAMFASRACRMSVMIGTPLNQKEMRAIVNHMGEMKQPWNCPHGRPTMRHLINLQMVFI